MITLRNITLRRGTKVLLDQVSATLNPGEKVGLVGRNGAGKSSLFALFNGSLHEDAGEFSVPAQWRLSQVAQHMPETDESATDFVLGGDTRLMELRAELAEAEAGEDGMRIAHAHSDLADAGEHDAVPRAQALILGLGFKVAELDLPVNSFSGGWRMRLQLARALMCPSDLLLLDEPTNHLDLDALVWLEAWLQRYPGTMVVISHDREFLDAVTTVTLHIDNARLTRYGGNYSAFELQRAQQLEMQQAAFARQQDRIAHLQKFIDRFKAKASKARQAQSRVKALERMEKIAPVLAEADFSFEFKEPASLPNPMLAITDAQLGYRPSPRPSPVHGRGSERLPLPLAGEGGGEGSSQPNGMLQLRGADLHNLRQVDVDVPLKRLVAVTGVSGSGKSTLARDVLLHNVQAAVQQRSTKAGRDADDRGRHPVWSGCESLDGYQAIDRVLEVDQTPIGKTPRSCPATYIGFWDTIRRLFADTLEAKARGYGPGRFSFNTGEGRCPTCEGQGVRTIAMSFLPDVKVPCESCHGARFNPETLAVTWRGKSIGDVLQMEVDEAVEFFASMPSISHPLQLLVDVGLGYLTLGQPSPTLSGGEAQRIKLVTELTKVRDDVTRRGQKAPHTLYVLDEPTVGLHMADVEKLIRVLHRLVDGGHSVVVIEHDLDVIAEADWIIDLGPEGGGEGGRVVAAAPPEEVVRLATHTGRALQPVLERT